MAESILKQGGQVVSILSVAITQKEWIEQQNETGEPPRIRFSRGGARVHNLTDYTVTPLDGEDYDADKLIPIDYSNVLPESGSRYNQYYSPVFTTTETFEHLEQAEAIDFSFYKFDDRHHTCALIIPKLLETHKAKIWNKIREPILSTAIQDRVTHTSQQNSNPSDEEFDQVTNTPILVTTYKHKDILFKGFVEDRLAEEGIRTATGVTLKRSVKDIPSRNLTLGARGREIKGKEVILVLATLSTTERLRNLVSLLVSCEVKKITVICLLNEMGPFTTGFINAIERFTKRVKTTNPAVSSEEHSFTDFAFHMVYSFLDIDNDDIAKMHEEVDWLFAQFSNRTKVPAFQRLSKRIKGYFQSHRYAVRTYKKSIYKSLRSRYTLDQHCDSALVTDQELLSISVKTQEAKIALITYTLSLYRDFKPILEELSQTLSRKTFFHLYGLILSDINYLQFTKTLLKLKDQILFRLDQIWQGCFEWEIENSSPEYQQQENNYLEKKIGPISYLLFGLGIVTHYESRINLGEISIKDLFFCRKSPEDWIRYHPQFMWEYFSDERIPYFIAFLLQSLYPKLPQVSGQDRRSIEDLNATVSEFKRVFSDYAQMLDNQGSELSKSRIQLINNNLDTILMETGKHEQLEKHQTIRYLHREVLRPKEGHNPVFTNLAILLRELGDFFEGCEDNGESRFQIGEKILTKLDDALNGTAQLSVITEAVRQLFYFTPSERTDRERYTSSASQNSSFARDVEDLVNLLTDMRLRRSFSYENYRSLQRLSRIIRDDFYDSKLRYGLQGYVISLDELLEKTLIEINERLNREGFQDVLQAEYERFRESRSNRRQPLLVLCDYYLLQETLRNIFYNLRYSFPGERRSSLSQEAVRISFSENRFTVKPDNQSQDGIVLELFVEGNPPSPEDLQSSEKTIADQLFKLQEFGAQWELIPNDSFDAYMLKLTFISRSGFVSRSSF
ncbi:MAG: hypothetical protein F6K19_37635 [Cyanothece sp. SIO1E1]|nr:hypothetical protein [Cyanothece sp. SIO1E1]